MSSVIFVTVFSAVNETLPVDNQALSIIGITTSSPILSIIGSRLLFHMREVAEETQFCQARDGALGFKSSRGGVAQVSDIEFTGFPGPCCRY